MLAPFAMRRRFPWNVAFFASLATLVLTLHASVAADLPAAFAATTDLNEVAKLVGTDAAKDDYAGAAIAVSGDTAIVGAPFADIGGVNSQGAAFVLVKSGGTWTQQIKLTAFDGVAGAGFGRAVGISGDTVVVTTVGDDESVGSAAQGAAYVFVRTGTTWTLQQTLTDPTGVVADNFGASVSIDGDTVVVGGAMLGGPIT